MSNVKMIPEKIGKSHVTVKIPLSLWERIDELVELKGDKLKLYSINDVVKKALTDFIDTNLNR